MQPEQEKIDHMFILKCTDYKIIKKFINSKYEVTLLTS